MFQKLSAFIQESKQEFKRVNWPDRATTMRYTFFVIGLSVGLSLFLGALDFLFLETIKATLL
jgi:preprotein translocase SecE subunit